MHLVLHIGTEKTGSTAIQSVLSACRNELLDQGFWVMRSSEGGNNRAIPALFSDRGLDDDFFYEKNLRCNLKIEEFLKNLKIDFEKEFRSIPKNVENVIITSEHFHSRLGNLSNIEDLKKFLDRYFSSYTVVVYLRDQVEVIESLYSTALKCGHRTDILSFFREKSTDYKYFNYKLLLDRWSEAFGRDAIKPILYSKARVEEGGVLGNFMRLLGVSVNADQKKENANASFGPFGEALFRNINSVFPTYIDGAYTGWISILGRISRRAAKYFFRKKIYDGNIVFHNSLKIAIREAYGASNDVMFREYFDDETRTFY